MTGIGGSGEVRLEDVAEELAADRATPRRRTDDGDAPRLEERAQRCNDGGVIAFLDTELEPLRCRDREPHLDDAAGELALQLEAGTLEDAEHRHVLGEHLGDEALDPDLRRARGQPFEQSRPDPPPLLRVGDGEGGLGERRVAQADVVADRDDPLAALVGERAEQSTALGPVRLEQRLDELRPQVRQAVEPAVQALRRERPVEVEQSGASDRLGDLSLSVPPSRRITSTESPAVVAIVCIRSTLPAPGRGEGRAGRPALHPIAARGA